MSQDFATPSKPTNVPRNAQWLSGDGAGSWFYIKNHIANYIVIRYSETGKIECAGIFATHNGEVLDLKLKYSFTYISHCQFVNLHQKNSNIILNRIAFINPTDYEKIGEVS